MKRIFFFTFYLSLFFHCVYAQSKINLSPNLRIGYPSVLLGTPDEFSLPKNVTSTVTGILFISIGGDLQYSLSKKLTLQIGLNTSIAKYNQKFFGLTWGTDFDPATGIVHKSVTKNSLNIWQINSPIVSKYFSSQKLSYNLGIIPQIILFQKAISKIEYIDNWRSAINNGTIQYPLKKFNPALTAGVSFYKKLNRNMLVEISPYVQINMIADDLYFYYAKNRFYQAGLSINLEKIVSKGTSSKKR